MKAGNGSLIAASQRMRGNGAVYNNNMAASWRNAGVELYALYYVSIMKP